MSSYVIYGYYSACFYVLDTIHEYANELLLLPGYALSFLLMMITVK